jgi:hypothetical protein
MRRNAYGVVAAVSALALVAGVAPAFADNLVSDGDAMTPLSNSDWALGDVCVGSTVSSTIPVFLTRQGNAANGPVYTDNAEVSVSGVSSAGATVDPGTKIIAVSGSWTTAPNTTRSPAVDFTVAVTAPSMAGVAFARTVTFTSSGARAGGGTLALEDVLQISGRTVVCDSTAPTASAGGSTGAGTYTAGSWTNQDVIVELAAQDETGGSGVKEIRWSTNGPATTTSSVYTAPITVSAEGTTTISYLAIDKAGNASVPQTFVVAIDKTAPVVTPSDVTDGAWRGSAFSQDFTASDELSGLADDSDAAFTLTASAESPADGSTSVDRTVTDRAGNSTTRTLSARIDLSAPLVSPDDVVDTTWRNQPLSQDFTATDDRSGLADAADATFTLTASAESADGATPTVVSRQVLDAVGNATTRSVSARIDLTDPTVSLVGGPSAGTRYFTSTVPTAPTCDASDALSGIASCVVDGYSTAEGTHTVTATATDLAGNTSSASVTYTVRNLTRSGFFSPVDMGGVWNSIKGGNTVPLKFEVFDDGQELTSTAVVRGFTVAKVSCVGTSADEVEVFSTTGQTELRYDATAGQFVQNWKTPTGSGCYTVTLTTVDGQSISAKFQTRK